MRMYDLLKCNVFSSKGIGQEGAGFMIDALSPKYARGYFTVTEYSLLNGRKVSDDIKFPTRELLEWNVAVVSDKVLARVPVESDLGRRLKGIAKK